MIFRIDQGIAFTTPRGHANVLAGLEIRRAETSRSVKFRIAGNTDKTIFSDVDYGSGIRHSG